MQTHYVRLLLVACIALPLAACEANASNDASAPPATPAAPSAPPAAAPAAPTAPGMDVSASGDYAHGGSVTIRNTDAAGFTIDKIVVNGQAGDPSCEIHVYKAVAADHQVTLDVPRCGDIRSVDVQTDRGEKQVTFTTNSVSLSTDDEGAATIVVSNNGAAPIDVQKLVLNDQADDQNCNLKVFKSVQPDDRITIPAAGCGAITKIDLTIDNQSSTVRF